MKRNKTISAILFSVFFVLSSFGQIEETFPRFEQPLLITSAGQSADVQIAGVLTKRAGLSAVLSKEATEAELESIKTVALVIGVSMKGLGAAGSDPDQEKTRIKALLEAARSKNIPLLCLHLGGEARRGELTDQMIEAFIPQAQMVIVVKSGNQDGLFTRICNEKNIPLIEVEKTVDAQESLQQIFMR